MSDRLCDVMELSALISNIAVMETGDILSDDAGFVE
jgi:hypothetical protein